jgi:hypothetical protein
MHAGEASVNAGELGKGLYVAGQRLAAVRTNEVVDIDLALTVRADGRMTVRTVAGLHLGAAFGASVGHGKTSQRILLVASS